VQYYYNTQDEHIDAEFIFPVHSLVTFTQLELECNGVRTFGEVIRANEVEQKFLEACRKKITAASAQVLPDAPEIMKVRVGSLPPNKEIKIT
jgi:hypothetical protein